MLRVHAGHFLGMLVTAVVVGLGGLLAFVLGLLARTGVSFRSWLLLLLVP